MMKALLDEFLQHLDDMDRETGYNSEHWDKYKKLSSNLTGKAHKLPGDADMETVIKALQQLSLTNILRKPEKLSGELIAILKKAYAPKDEYNFIDSGLAIEYLQLFNGDESSWKAIWKQAQAVNSKIARFEYAPDPKKFNLLRELSAGLDLSPWLAVLQKYKMLILPGEDPKRMRNHIRPTILSSIALLSMEFSEERSTYLRDFIRREPDKATLLELNTVLKPGDPKYLALEDLIVDRLKELCANSFGVRLLEKAGIAPDWLKSPWYLSIHVADAPHDKNASSANGINFSADHQEEDIFFVDVRKDHSANYNVSYNWHQNSLTIDFSWDPQPENLEAYLENLAKQAGFKIDWSTLTTHVDKKHKKKLEAYIAGDVKAAVSKPKADPATEAEEIMDKYLHPNVTAIGAREEEKAVQLMRKLPAGVNEQKLFDTLIKLGNIRVFRFARNLRKEYLPVLRKALTHFMLVHPFNPMMISSLLYALEKDLNDADAYDGYVETAAFLQYINTLVTAVYSEEDFARSDKYITPAVAENAGRTLCKEAYGNGDFGSGDTIAFNSLLYAMGKHNFPLTLEASRLQLKYNKNPREIYCLVKAFAPNKHLSHTGEAYKLAEETLRRIQEQKISSRLAQAIGLGDVSTTWWGIDLIVGNEAQKYPQWSAGSVYIEISSMRDDYLSIRVVSPTGSEQLRYKDEADLDVFRLKPQVDRLAASLGVENLLWDKADIKLFNLEKTARKKIKDWLSAQ